MNETALPTLLACSANGSPTLRIKLSTIIIMSAAAVWPITLSTFRASFYFPSTIAKAVAGSRTR